jgi:hypothetical protein
VKKITAGDILDAEAYEKLRPEFRRKIMVRKARRRVPVGEHMMVHFETRDTMWYQVHELLRAERSWTRPGAIEDELEAYNPLIPEDSALSASLTLEYETPEEREMCLTELCGLDRHVCLQVGDRPRVAAAFDDAQVSPTRISSVQYLRWPLDPEAAEALQRDGTVVRIVVDHPRYEAQAVLAEETRREIAGDLATADAG